ncbi:MAG: alkaline phosphatase family protein, partial [Acidobacteria bacterium]|nr:alkaline phosphatase family protein [Acidobacteriota bacterium]
MKKALFGRVALPSALAVLPALAALLALACQRPAEPPPEGTPRLVVLIVVDQMRADYLDRFDRFWQGGLRYLLDNAVRFTDAHHDHAITATAPGHASLATGCFPSRHGVFTNYWIDRESGEEVYSAADDDWEITPERLECATLGDWLKKRYPASRVFAVSAKDRSAVLMAGRKADGAFFYDDSYDGWESASHGGWESAEYYYKEEPEWVGEFNDRRLLDRHFGEPWEPLAASLEDLEAVGVSAFDMGPLAPDLPIAFGGLAPAPGESFYAAIFASPYLDEHLARFAEHLIGAEALGGDEVPDLLALGFSAVDAVGHAYGPDSPQLLDTLRRLDVTLGELFEFLDRRVGLDNVVIALSSDHGAVPVPEVRQASGLPGRRADADDVLCMQRVYERLQGRFGDGAWLLPGPFVNREAVKTADLEYE